MQLYLIRHAESENNAKPLHRRVEDPPLTAIGRLQAQHLSDWIKTLKIDALVCSPVRRSLQTTRFISEINGQHVDVWVDLFEEGGIYSGFGPDAIEGGPGLSRGDVTALIGTESDCTLDESISDDGWWGRDRESADEAIARAVSVSNRLVETFSARGQTVAAIIHADFMRKLLTEMLAGLVDASSLGAIRNTGITKLDFDGEHWRLDWFNSVSHLPARLITGNES